MPVGLKTKKMSKYCHLHVWTGCSINIYTEVLIVICVFDLVVYQYLYKRRLGVGGVGAGGLQLELLSVGLSFTTKEQNKVGWWHIGYFCNTCWSCCDIIVMDCWAQNGSTNSHVFATFKCLCFTNRKRNSVINCCVLVYIFHSIPIIQLRMFL